MHLTLYYCQSLVLSPLSLYFASDKREVSMVIFPIGYARSPLQTILLQRCSLNQDHPQSLLLLLPGVPLQSSIHTLLHTHPMHTRSKVVCLDVADCVITSLTSLPATHNSLPSVSLLPPVVVQHWSSCKPWCHSCQLVCVDVANIKPISISVMPMLMSTTSRAGTVPRRSCCAPPSTAPPSTCLRWVRSWRSYTHSGRSSQARRR